MKSLFFAVALVALLGSKAEAQFTGVNAVMANSGCYVNVSTSSGSAKVGQDDSTVGCRCIDQGSNGCAIVVTTSACGSSFYNLGLTLENKYCCEKKYCLTEEREETAEVLVSSEVGLQDVYQPQERAMAYVGYLNSVPRSPSAGRGNQPAAKLDICLGETVVSGLYDFNGCAASCNDSTKNGYCTQAVYNNGVYQTAGACVDRCECMFGTGGTCEGQ